MSIIVSWQQRIARAEAMTDKQIAELPEMQEKALSTAIAMGDVETAAEIARSIRNRMLKDTDAEVALDRLGLAVPTGSSFTSWLTFLRTLGEALVGGWAQYRQALRDLPQQDGFPLTINWPVPPSDGRENGDFTTRLYTKTDNAEER